MSHTTIALPDESAIEGLRAGLRGELIQPSDENYHEARKVYNAMIDRRPALIARCAAVADVIVSVNFARENGLLLAVRGGGHNGAGLGICDGGLVIDLSQMKGVRVDPEKRTARVGGGCVWGEVDHATHAFGLATPSGIMSTTGVGGLTLGGGLGHLTRKCGLTIDNLLEVDVVLADGRFVTASADKNEDLFWAVRGGGVTSASLPRSCSGYTVQYHHRRADALVAGAGAGGHALVPRLHRQRSGRPQRLLRFSDRAPGPPFPEELHNRKMCGVVWCYTGPEERAEEVFAPVLEVGTPALHGVGAMPYPVLQSAFDALYPPDHQWYWKADFITEVSDEAIEQHTRHAEVPTLQSTMHLYPIDGAAHRVGKNETPWSYREANWGMVIVGVDPNPANREIIVEWAREYWEALHSHSAGGAYTNMMMEEGRDRVKASYRDNYERLVDVKREYDPTNLFRVNQNIKP